MLAHPVIPLPEVFAVAPTFFRVHVVKHNKVSHPEDLVLAISQQKLLGGMMGFTVRPKTVSVPGSFQAWKQGAAGVGRLPQVLGAGLWLSCSRGWGASSESNSALAKDAQGTE